MSPFEQMSALGHEQVVFCRDEASGLRAIIGVHDTSLGPALGGCRMYDYDSEADALRDVLRLSRGMTYKAAMAGLDLGGGKAVIIGDRSMKSEALFRAFGRFVDSLGGRYITAEDMNTNEHDMELIGRETRWVTGRSAAQGGSGDPSPVTAWGVFHGIRGALEVATGSPELAGRTVAIQGVGNVGFHLARALLDAGAGLMYSDVNPDNIERAISQFGGEILDGDAYYAAPADVLAPCAIGGILNPSTLPKIQAVVVAGGANNVLEHEQRDGADLVARGITYAPDYVINAGGLMNVAGELVHAPAGKAMNDAARIYETVRELLYKARAEGVTPTEASNRMAEARIAKIRGVKRLWTGRL